MIDREWRTVTKAAPCPACGKPDWCAWTHEGWLKCERSTDAPPGMTRVSIKDRGAVFRPDDPHRPPRKAGPARQRGTPATKSTKVYSTARDAVDLLRHELTTIDARRRTALPETPPTPALRRGGPVPLHRSAEGGGT
jgi:hypothetical protein